MSNQPQEEDLHRKKLNEVYTAYENLSSIHRFFIHLFFRNLIHSLYEVLRERPITYIGFEIHLILYKACMIIGKIRLFILSKLFPSLYFLLTDCKSKKNYVDFLKTIYPNANKIVEDFLRKMIKRDGGL